MRTTRQPKSDAPVARQRKDSLIGVPGLGPAKIAALQAAGIKNRTQLASASVEQLVAIKGFRQTLAEQALAFVRNTSSPSNTPAPPTDEMMPDKLVVGAMPDAPEAGESEADAPDPDEPEPTAPEPESPESDLDRALLTARTALADATRNFPALDAPLTKLARRLEKLPEKAAPLPEKKQIKIVVRLDKLTARLEEASLKPDDLTKGQRKRLHERVEAERDALRDAVKSAKKKKGKK